MVFVSLLYHAYIPGTQLTQLECITKMARLVPQTQFHVFSF
jgi:hypothetical protein